VQGHSGLAVAGPADDRHAVLGQRFGAYPVFGEDDGKRGLPELGVRVGQKRPGQHVDGDDEAAAAGRCGRDLQGCVVEEG